MVWIAAGAGLCALSIAGGAFGAHALEARLDRASLALWDTAARYLMAGGVGLLATGLTGHLLARPLSGAAWSLLAGALIFSGTVAALALGAPRILGAVTPIGGLLLIAGYLLLALGALTAR